MLSARRIVIDRSKKEQEIFRDPTDVLLPAASHFRFMCAGASPVQIHPCVRDARAERPHELDTKFSHMSAYNANISPI